MSALVVGGIVVPVAPVGASRKPVPIGDQDRADDGTPVSDVSRTTDDLVVRTIAMAPAAAAALRAKIRGAMPVSCYGDLLGVAAAGALSCDLQLSEDTPVRAADGLRWSFAFTVRVP